MTEKRNHDSVKRDAVDGKRCLLKFYLRDLFVSLLEPSTNSRYKARGARTSRYHCISLPRVPHLEGHGVTEALFEIFEHKMNVKHARCSKDTDASRNSELSRRQNNFKGVRRTDMSALSILVSGVSETTHLRRNLLASIGVHIVGLGLDGDGGESLSGRGHSTSNSL